MREAGAAGPGGGARSVATTTVLAAAARHYLAQRPIDMSVLAAELGVGRATLYRRIGNREDLWGAVLADQTERTFRALPLPRDREGVDAVCAVLSAFVGAVVESRPLRALIDRDPVLFVRVVMGPGPVEDRGAELVEGLIVSQLGDALQAPPHLLARTIVRMSDATMYTHLLTRRPAELDDLLRLVRIVLVAATPAGAGTTGEGAVDER